MSVQVARVGNSVVMTGFGHPVGRRVRQPQLSELDINWTNTVHNSKISDLQCEKDGVTP